MPRPEPEVGVRSPSERLDGFLSYSLTRPLEGGPPKGERTMKKRAPLRSNIEASRPPGRPCGLLYPTPCPHQRQTAADRGFVHFEVSRHVRCAQALHRP